MSVDICSNFITPFSAEISHLFFAKENDWGFSHFVAWNVSHFTSTLDSGIEFSKIPVYMYHLHWSLWLSIDGFF